MVSGLGLMVYGLGFRAGRVRSNVGAFIIRIGLL